MDSALIRKKQFFDGIASRWRAGNPLEEEEREFVNSCLSHLELRDGEVVLDLGGGTGRLSGYLFRNFPVSCLVLDISRRMLREGLVNLSANGISWLEADGHELPLRRESVQHIICYCAFPHFDHQEKVVRECRRILRPGGNFLIIHNRSREGINRFHSRQNKVIASDHLPSLVSFRRWGRCFNLEAKKLENKTGRFIVHYRKPE